MSTTAPDQRVTAYQPTVATIEFAALFPIFDNYDIAVLHNGEPRTDFTVTATYSDGVSNDAKVHFASGLIGRVMIVGERAPRRQNSFGAGPIPARNLNAAFDTIQGEMQEARRDIERSLKVAIGSNIAADLSPVPNRVIGWDSAGELTTLDVIPKGEVLFGATGEELAGASTAAQARAILYELRAFSGDGTTDDSANFVALESNLTGKLIDLMGRTFVVSAIPSANMYVNGFWKIGGMIYDALQSLALISSASDTGGIGAGYTGGIRPVPTTPGRTTSHLYALIASQGCRAEGPSRAVNVGSIYSWAKGNVSGNYSSRQCNAWVPQSVNLASEECRIYGGFRGANVASIYSDCTNESNVNIACRYSYATGRNSGNLFSTNAIAGRGYGAEFNGITVASGVITGGSLISGGLLYNVGDTIVFFDRTGLGTGAVAVVTAVDASGTITAWSMTSGGSGYSNNIDATVDNGTGDFSFNIGTINNSRVYGTASGNLATNDCRVGAGPHSVNLAGAQNGNDGTQSLIAASGGSTISPAGSLSWILGGNNSQVTAAEAGALGRRIVNPIQREIAGGDASTGAALSANRKWSISNATGLIKTVQATSVGTFSDVAEYFPNGTGTEIPVATIVMLEGDAVVPWDGSGAIVGVISATAAFIAGDSHFTWASRYLYDKFGRPVWVDGIDEDTGEAIKVQAENPYFDPSIINIPRSDRPDEWSLVGVVGQVFTRVDETAKAGDMIGDKLQVMKITTSYQESDGYAVARCFIS